MRFMMLMIPKGYETAKAGAMPSAEKVAAMTRFNDQLAKAGVLLSLDGLHPPSAGARVSFPKGKAQVTDGPFAEAKECVGGYWMIQVKSKQEALEWASRCPASENEVIEVRQVQELSDFPPDVQKAAGERPVSVQTPRKVEPYLSFDGRCEEALEFYRGALGAEITALLRMKEAPPGGPPRPPGTDDKVMHAAFRIGDTTLLASDGECTGKATFQGMSLALTTPNDAAAERMFAALAAGGQIHMPLHQTFFSSRFGVVADRFGVTWMVTVGA